MQGFLALRPVFRASENLEIEISQLAYAAQPMRPSLRRTIFFVGLKSKYKHTSSIARLESGTPETFSASPK